MEQEHVTLGQLLQLLQNIQNVLYEIANNLKAFNDHFRPTIDTSTVVGTMDSGYFIEGRTVPPVGGGGCADE
jgi:hypothetical protein